MTDQFSKKLSELRMAVSGFLAQFPGDRSNAVSHVSSMAQIIKEIDDVWKKYCNASEMAEATRFHNRIRSKTLFLRTHLVDSKKSCGSKDGGKYSEGQDYLQKKINEFLECIPKEPSVMQEALPIIEQPEEDIRVTDNYSDGNAKKAIWQPEIPEEIEDDTKPVPEIPSEEQIIRQSFPKKSNELLQSVNAFVRAHKDQKGVNSVVGYIDDIRIYIKVLDNIWNKYWTFLDQSCVDNEYKSMFVQLKNIRSYLDSSKLIAETNNCAVKYIEGHKYIEKKIDEFAAVFPTSCRELAKKADAYAISSREKVDVDSIKIRKRRTNSIGSPRKKKK